MEDGKRAGRLCVVKSAVARHTRWCATRLLDHDHRASGQNSDDLQSMSAEGQGDPGEDHGSRYHERCALDIAHNVYLRSWDVARPRVWTVNSEKSSDNEVAQFISTL